MTDEQLKEKLNAEQYRVMREKDTERPYSGKYWDNEDAGVYACAACGTVLFASLAQFDSETGWPSFHSGIHEKYFTSTEDERGTEISCKKCGSHLGYLVPEEKGKKSYYRVNSASLEFQPIEVELEDLEDSMDTQHSTNEASAQQPTLPSISSFASMFQNVLPVGAAALIGAVLGGGAGFFLCQAPPLTAVQAVVPPAAEPSVTTSATFVPPKPRNTSQTPVSASSAAQPATSSAPAGSASSATSSSSDGTL